MTFEFDIGQAAVLEQELLAARAQGENAVGAYAFNAFGAFIENAVG